ncbi:hypothetical protein [Alteromonas flava]|uniref:hypothetical protein n=1 Tax=Alteromonas flava TaxID=2048003 RepID=UPI000C2939F2|nr:hypothetical protein [Alteromonas flava]
MKKIVCALALAGISQLASAQETLPTHSTSGEWDVGVRAATINIDEATALSQGVEDTAYFIGFTGNYLQNNWITTLGMDIVVYDDNAEFSQVVVGDGLFNDGDVSTESSSANGILLSVATGYQWVFGERADVSFALQGGFSQMLYSERSIDYCSNCYSEDIDVDGGLFVQATLMKHNESIDVGLFLQQYVSGDGVDNALGAHLRFRF